MYSQLRISEPPLGKRKMVRLSEVVRLSGIRISERREKKVRLSEVLQKITGPGGGSLARSLFLVFRLKNGTSIKPKFESYPQHKSCKSIEFKFVFLADKNYHHFRGFTYKMRSSFPAH